MCIRDSYFAENMILSLIETKKMEIERAKDEIRTVCEWTINSNIPVLYTKKYFQFLANNHNLERLKNND